MRTLTKSILAGLILTASITASAQSDTIRFDVSASGVISSGEYSPFWLQSNRYGKVSSAPSSANLMIGLRKGYKSEQAFFDYGFGASMLVQTDKTKSSARFHELYAKAHLYVFDMAVGKREEQYGSQDSSLSCGGFLFSTNTRPMPKIYAGIEHFTAIPYTFGLIEIKGGLSHGWFTDNIYTKNLFLHHKYLYGRLGGKLPVQLQYGLDHVAQWGGTTPDNGPMPAGLKDYITVFRGKSGGTGGEAINTLGNHIIGQTLRLDARISGFRAAIYWQNIIEDKPRSFIGKTMNKADGLWGISIRNKYFPYVNGVVYEFLRTSDQSGPYHDKDGIVYGGADSYFRNYIYYNGWTYFSRTIGTPFISSPLYNKNGSVTITNNRVHVHHWGLEGNIAGYNYKALASFSKNYGIYGSPINISNTSALLEVNKRFPKLSDIEIGCSAGADYGKLYGNSFGVLVSIRKNGNLLHY